MTALNSKTNFFRLILCKQIFLLMFLFCLSVVSAEAVPPNPVFVRNYQVGGTVFLSTNVPNPNTPVVLRIKSYLDNQQKDEVVMALITVVVITDSNGHFGPITVPCFRDSIPSNYSTQLIAEAAILRTGVLSWSRISRSSCNEAGEPWANALTLNGSSDLLLDFQNAGPSCKTGGIAILSVQPNQDIGEPVNTTNGNMWLSQTDYTLPGIGENIMVSRYYNSVIQESGLFGWGWKTEYDESITNSNNDYLTLRTGTGRGIYFVNKGDNVNFQSASIGVYANVVKNTDNYTLTFKDGRVHQFYSNGKLHWQKDRNGNQTTLTYSGANGTGFLESVTDAFGRTLTFDSNSNGTIYKIYDSLTSQTNPIATYDYYDPPDSLLLKTVTYQDGSQYKFEYTTVSGKVYLQTVKDALNNILETHEYDSQGRATTSEKHGGVEKYTFDYSHWTDTIPYTSVKYKKNANDPDIETKYYFDKSKGRNVVTKTEGACNCGSGSEVTTYEYDEKLNIKKKVDALNREMNYTYDTGNPNPMRHGDRLTANFKIGTTDLGTDAFTYNNFGQILTWTDRMNGLWQYEYDANGNLKKVTDALSNVTTITYPTTNNKGLPEKIKDARLNETKFSWNSAGLLQEIEDPYNKKTNYTYDARGRIKTVTNALNHTTTYNYFDDTQRKVEMIYPNSDKITYKYDIRRLLESITDERGKMTTYTFDTAYRLTQITDALSHTREYGYDLMSNLKFSKDALGNQTDYKYDDFNRLKEVEYPLAETGATRLKEKFEYDLVGRIKKITDTALRETVYNYDDALRTISVTNAEQETTQTKFNARMQAIEVKDALNQLYTFTYNPFGQTLTQTRAGATMSYEYDENLNRKKRTDYAGRVTDYTYDKLNRLTKIEYDNGANNPMPKLQATYNYDDISRLTSAVNEAGTVSFGYDNHNRVTSTTDVFGHLINYEYERTATVNQERLKFDGALYASYNFDDANRLSNIVNSADSTQISFGYDNADRLTSRNYPNGISTTYEYDGMSRLKRLKDVSQTATLFDRQYSYNSASQISQIVEPTLTRTIGYDFVNRLTSVTASNNQNESYNFDDVGNRTSSHRSASYGYQPFNKVISTATANYVYDANGNMVSKAEGMNFWRYGYDFENRLVSASTRKQTVRYRYDALGRRVQRYTVRGNENTKFIYDGQDVLVDDTSGTLTKYLNGEGIDNKLRSQTGSDVSYFLTDHLGSTNGLTDANGNLTSSTSYDSFGNATGNLSTRYQFTGREFDDFTGLYFYRARWYDAQIGRFISEDPLDFKGGDINFYSYVSNSPTNFSDPLGLEVTGRYYRRGGKENTGKLEVYDYEKPTGYNWVDNPNAYDGVFVPKEGDEVSLPNIPPVGDYQLQYQGATIDEGMFSGIGDCKNVPECETTPFNGPIPSGEYVIANDPNPSAPNRNGNRWYGLYRKQPDGSYSDFAPIGNGGVKRGQFRWHIGSVSQGCLTFDGNLRETYDRLDGTIQGTSKMTFYNGDTKTYQSGYGTITVY